MPLSKWSKLLKTLLTKRQKGTKQRTMTDGMIDDGRSVMSAIYDLNGHLFPSDKLFKNIEKIRDPIILKRLSRHPNKRVRQAVAENAGTPDAVFKKLRRDLRKGVSLADADEWGTPDDILEKLSTDGNWKVRLAVAKNKNTPVHVLEMLKKRMEI